MDEFEQTLENLRRVTAEMGRELQGIITNLPLIAVAIWRANTDVN